MSVTDFIFLDSKITVDGDCSHEIKRHLLLRRKGMTNLGSTLKSKDNTWPTKSCIVKAMVFPVVMFGCESWSIKKAEHWRIDAFDVLLEKTLESPLDSKEIKPIHPKGNQPWISLEGLMLKLKLQYSGHLMWRNDSLEKILMLQKIKGKKENRAAEVRCYYWLSGHDFHLEIVKDGGTWCATVHGVAQSRTWIIKWTTTKRR